MAADKSSLEQSIEVLNNEITCAVCHEHCTEPKVLPCCHYYCKQCIHSLALRTGLNKPFSCPECRKDTTLPQGGVDDLPPAAFVNRMKDVHAKLELAHGTVEAKCESCSEDKACAYCHHCSKFICDDCVKSHIRMKRTFSGHKIVTLTELKEKGAEEIMTLERQPSYQLCNKHDQPLNMYCYDCKETICRDCTITAHNKHNYEFIKVAGHEMKEKLTQQLDQLKQIKGNLSHAIEQVHTTKSELEAQGKSVAEYVKNSFSKIRMIADNCEQELLLSSSEKVAKKLEHLSAQGKSLDAAQTAIETVIGYTDQHIKQDDSDVILAYANVQSRIDQEIEEQRKEEKNLKPVEDVDIGVEVSCLEELKQLFQTKAKILQLPLDPSKCTVTLDQTKVEVNQVAKFQLITRLNNGTPTREKCNIKCYLKSLKNGSTCECEIDSVDGSEYHIAFTPTIHGPNQLTVTVNGEDIVGSPFPVFVSIDPNRIGKPVGCIPGFNNPRDVAINSIGNIIVTEQKGIVVLDGNGRRLKSYKSSEYGINDLFCVAVDSTDDSIYITGNSNTNHKIVKLNPHFAQVKEFSSKEKLHFRGLIVKGDEVIACQRDKGIAVYTKELEHVKQIAFREINPDQFGGLRDISSDKDSNLYVSDYDKSCILVFDKDGEFSRSFSCDENGINKLKGPRGVWVAGQYVYVANWYSHKVTVFTTGGEYISSFGQKRGSEANFKNPWGVCVDKDGFVYICDQGNNRVQIF